ncbi:hypothetical protein F0L17_03550 [Streptomyces sp. TRM43335]|uniref:DUF624 domain-containing protein n=1 Tax=Streptomyces taklimakanensis TaxID=2569853 RepID=A0A6G2B7I9_9ACTN|nr:hypothetical protein [Streptomyces taklimakanensis]
MDRRSLADRFALFAECLLVGVWLLLAALPLVTALPAFAAACGHLRRHLAAERAGWREFAAEWATAVRTGWRFSLLWWAALALLAFDLRVASSGVLPGGPVAVAVGAVAAVAALAVVVTGLRTAALWRPGADWARTGRAAIRRAWRADPGGSLLLAGGPAVTAVAAWMLPPLIAPALGCLAACAVAVERRHGHP